MQNILLKKFFSATLAIIAALTFLFPQKIVLAQGCCQYEKGCGTFHADKDYLRDPNTWHDVNELTCNIYKGNYYRDATCEFDEKGENGKCESISKTSEEIPEEEPVSEEEENPEEVLGDGTAPEERTLPAPAAPTSPETADKPEKKEFCSPGKFCLQVPFPGSDAVEKAVDSKEEVLLVYIKVFFQFAVWLSITLAIFMAMLSGFLWLTAGGDAGRVSQAKDRISNAITGMVIALLSFLILQGINPRLVSLSIPTIENIPVTEGGDDCCINTNTKKTIFTKLPGRTKDSRGRTIYKYEQCEEQLQVYYGPGWISCSAGSACVCKYRLEGQDIIECNDIIPSDDCKNIGGKICTHYPDTVCEKMKKDGVIPYVSRGPYS